MAVQAAVDGLGVALGRTRFVEADIAAGRLVVPFDVVLPADAGFYIVAPEDTADTPKIALFRDWLLASVTPGAVAPPPNLPPTRLALRGVKRGSSLPPTTTEP
jgi:LysR family glycine cleavage system transcriptional activator